MLQLPLSFSFPMCAKQIQSGIADTQGAIGLARHYDGFNACATMVREAPLSHIEA